MSLPTWENLISKINSFKEAANNKKSTFQGHDDIMESSVKASFLFLPKPLDRIAEIIYMKHNGTAEEKIDAVIKYFNNLIKDAQHYNKVKDELDDILSKLEDSKYDPVIARNEDIVESLKQILISDEEDRKRLVKGLINYVK